MPTDRISRLLQEMPAQVYSAHGPDALSRGQWATLRYLRTARQDMRTIGAIAAHLQMTQAPASRTVASLARRNLISVTTDINDARRAFLTLTAKGEALLASDPIHKLEMIIAELPADSRQSLSAALTSIHEGLRDSHA